MKKRAISRLRAFRLFLKTSKYGSLAIIILGGLTVWAVVPGEKIETLEAYPAKAVSGDNEDFGSGAGWSNLNNALGRPDALSNGKIENFSDANSATYKAGSSNLIVSNFLEEERNASGYYENKNFLSAKIKFSFATGEKKADLEIRGNENLFAIQNAKADENKENFIDSAEDEIISASPEAVSNFNDAGNLPNIDAKIIIWYSLDGEIWWKLDTISGYYLSNALNGGYFSFDTPLIKNWDDIKNLKIKFEGVVGGETRTVSYLDSVWIEAEYSDLKEAENGNDAKSKDSNNDAEIRSLSSKKDFKSGEDAELKFHYQKENSGFLSSLGEVLGIADKWKNVKTTAKITNPKGEESTDITPEVSFDQDDNIVLKVKRPQQFSPGLYKVKLAIEDSGQTKEFNQNFEWGVLAINVNKSIYLPNEQAYLQMAALKDDGHTICDANLKLEITSPNGVAITPEIQKSGDCGPDNVTDKPDYFAYYQTSEAGNYQMKLTNADNGYEIIDSFEVKDSVPFEVERIGPTRIYPFAAYGITLKIKANQEFKGGIRETVPSSFAITNPQINIKDKKSGQYIPYYSRFISQQSGAEKNLLWPDINLKDGDGLEIKYTFLAPNISPYIYTLNPLEFVDSLAIPRILSETASENIGSFEIERSGPTETGEANIYQMATKVRVKEDFEGFAVDLMPNEFEITSERIFRNTTKNVGDKIAVTKELIRDMNDPSPIDAPVNLHTISNGKFNEVVWQVPWKAGETYDLIFQFNPHGLDPKLVKDFLKFTTAKSIFESQDKNQFDWSKAESSGIFGAEKIIFQESRSWQIASDAATAAKYPGTAVDDATVGSVAWSNPGFVSADDTSYATAGPTDNQITHYIKATNFGFTTSDIPTNSTIDGIVVNVYRYVATASRIKDYSVRLVQGGTIAGNNYADTTNYWAAAWTLASFGTGTTDKWGLTWTDAQIRASTFGVAFSVNKPTTSTGVYTPTVDYITITVYYTPSITISGTSNASSGTVKLAINGTLQSQTGTISGSTWSIASVSPPAAGDIITTWIDAVADTAESTAVAKYNGATTVSGMVLNTNVLSLGSSENQSLSVTDLNNYDCTQSEDIMHDGASSTLAVQGCTNSYSAPAISILASNTLTISGTETLTTYDITIAGTLTSTTTATYNISHNWTNNGIFTQATSTVTFNGTTAQAIAGSATTTFNNLTVTNTSAAISSSVNFDVAGTMNMNGANTLFTPGAAVVINNAGAQGIITGSGTVQVTRTAVIADYSSQYKFTTDTLTNLTVDYNGTGEVLSNLTYGNLKISGSITGASNTATVGGIFTNTGIFTPTSGTVTFNNGASIVYTSGTLTFSGLTVVDSATVISIGNFAVAGTFTVGPTAAATFTPSAADVISGAGTLTGYGTVQVTRTTATADFSSQYAITTKTLTNLTVEYAGASAQTVSSITYGHLKINMAGQAATLGGAITVNGNLTIAAGTLDTGNTLNYGIIVKGNWSNSGTFTARAGTVTFNGAGSQSISGANTWYGLAVTASAARTVSFQSSVTQTIAANGSLTFTGALGQLLTLAPVTAATNWLLSVNNTNVTQSISYVSVSYSDATGVAGANTAVNATNGTNSGTFTTNWNFTLGITVSGNAYADEGTTVWAGCNGTDARISLVVNGGTAQTASCNGGTGAYSFSNVTVALNNPVSVFFNTAGANTDKGVVVTIAKDATTAITVNPRKNIVWVTAENSATSVTNANLNHCDSNSPAQCANVPYAVDVSSNLTVADGAELHIETSKTFAPAGTVTTSPSSVAGDRDGDIHIAGTFSVGTYAVSVGGDWNNVGTFSKTNPQTTTFTATGTGFNINTGGSNFNNIVFNGASGGWTAITNTFTVDGTLTITAGNFDTGAVANAITGATGVTGTLTHSSATGAKTFTGDVTINAGGVWNETAAAAINFGGSLINNATTWTGSTGTHTFTGTAKTISGSTIITIPNISVSGTVTNSGTMTVSTTLAGAGGFTNGNGVAGTLNFGGASIGVTTFTASAASNTVVYNGASATSVRAATYDTLTVGAANSANVVYTALGNITANNNINLQSAALTYVNTFDLDNYNLTVGSAGVVNSGGIAVPIRSVFNQDGGTTTVNSSSAGSATIGGAGTTTFWNLIVGAASDNTTYNFNLGGAIAVSNDLTVTAGGAGTHTLDVTASNYGLTVGGSWTNNSTFAKQGGTVTFGSGWSYKKALVLSGVNLTDYQVKFTVYQGNGTDDNATNTVYCNGKCRAAAASPNGYGDIRFTDSSGNHLSYWIEDSAASPAIIWVKIPTIVSGGTTIYMLYGNSSATTTSNGANTFISFLNFENTIEGFDGGTSTTAQYKFDSYSFDLASANRHKAIAMPTKPFTLMMWVRPSGTTQNSTLQFENTYNTDGAYIGTNYGFAGKWVYYDAGWKSTGISFAAQWYKIELMYGTSAYDIVIDGSTVVTGAAYTTAAAVNGYQLSSDAAFYIDGLIQRKSAAAEPTKVWGSETVRTIADGGSPFFNIIFNDSGSGAVWLYQDGASIAPNQTTVQNGTPTYLNAKTGTVSVTGGTLNVDWYLGVHAVDAANTATDIDTAANDITISENSGTPASTVWRYDGTSWGSGATSQTTDTAASGKNPQPAAAGAIRIREYSKTSAATAYYSYNLKINWVLQGGTNYGEYDYYADYGGNYLTSSANPAAGDKTISVSWYRSASGTMNGLKEYDGVNNPPTQGSWYLGMLNGLSFSIDSFSVNFGNIDPGANPSDAANTLTVSTSATNGYVITAWSSAAMTCSDAGACGTAAIADWGGTNASPVTWPAGSYGFGYSTNDITLTGGTANRFSGPNFAGFVHSGAGDPVADRSNTECPCNNQTNTITYRIAAGATQRPGPYSATIIYVLTAQY